MPPLPLFSSTAATVGFVSHAAAALGFLVLIILLVVRQRVRGLGLLFVAALLLTIGWAVATALDDLTDQSPGPVADLLDIVRIGCWLSFLGALLTPALARRPRGLVPLAVCALTVGNLISILARNGWLRLDGLPLGDPGWELVLRLALPVTGLILIENLVRNGTRDGLWSGKFLFLALGAMWAYDLFVDAHALLFRQVDADLLAPRGAVQLLIVPLLAVAAARNPSWRLGIGVSRDAVFHSAALMGSGLFLLLMACAGYYLRQFGGSWGPLLQVTFLTGAGILLVVIVASGRARGQLRVFINKHFFSYKYDYRLEWHRFIDTLAAAEGSGSLRERVIEAVADIMDSPGGAIWLRPAGASAYVQTASWNFPATPAVEDAQGELARYLETTERIIALPLDRYSPEQRAQLELPEWLDAAKHAWLVVPLRHHDGLLGFLVLRQPRAPRSLNWEDWDLLRTVGHQAASYLAEQEAIQAVADARQLEAFNRRFAFVVHDLKNLVSPLAMLLSNATRHGDNPAFQQDLIATVGDSVARMKRMLTELGAEPRSRVRATTISVGTLLEAVGRARAHPALTVEPVTPDLSLVADADGLETAIGHLVQNALEAVRGTGRVCLRALRREARVVIEVEDDGCGMSAAFIRDELFRPLSTTKSSGYGIGAFQARELVREMGGQLDVASTPGLGTTMRVSFPIATPAAIRPEAGTVASEFAPTGAGAAP